MKQQSSQESVQDPQLELNFVESQRLNEEKTENMPFKSVRPYWNYYFSTVAPSELNTNIMLHKIIFALKESSKTEYFDELFKLKMLEVKPNGQFYEIVLDYSRVKMVMSKYIQKGDQLASVVYEMLENFQFDALAILQSFSLIIHSLLVEQKKLPSKKVLIMIENYQMADMNSIKANMIDNFISFEGVVLKVYGVRLMPVSFQFKCMECKGNFRHYLVDGVFTQPNRCRAQDSNKKQCKSRIFQTIKESIETIFIQRLKLQQLDSQGRTPRQIMCELRENLVGKVITGETLRVAGIIRTESTDEKDKKTQAIFIPYIHVNNIIQKESNSHNLQPQDLKMIEDMRYNPYIFYSLIKSFCPTIYGHELVKAGILMGLIGGSAKCLNDQQTFRQTSHILLLGDPGIGKSQMLKFASQLLPHSVYVNGTATSTAGLTVTINKENNQQSLEAGALILADNGICAIDEFDKTADSSSLLQVMEQQTISIAKAGVICQLKCRVGVIASANPVNGCYNKAKSFKDNTKISNAILSRFDLIFLLMDKPDPERDRKLAEHIMKMHNKKKKKPHEDPTIKQSFNSVQMYSQFLSLAEKYTKMCDYYKPEVYPIDKLKKYLTYIKSQVHPILSSEACQILKSFYMVLRENNPTHSFQITTRQLQSLIRLSMARARIECRSVVTQEDAIEVTQLMQESLFDSFEEMGYNINSLRDSMITTKTGRLGKRNGELSQPKQRVLFVNSLREKNDEHGDIWQWADLVKQAKELELNVGDFYMFIEKLNQEGILLSKGAKKYQFKDTFL